MNIGELEKRLEGTHNFSDIKDCHAVVKMLLRDLDIARKGEDKKEKGLKTLALAVRHNPVKSEELAEQALSKHKNVPKNILSFLRGMSEEMIQAENLSDEVLTDNVLKDVWGDLDLNGRPSAVLEEMIRRFRNLTNQKK